MLLSSKYMRYLKIFIFILLMAVFILPMSYPKDKEPAKAKLPQELQDKVKDAVEQGTQALWGIVSRISEYTFNLTDHHDIKHTMRYDEMVLYTLAHCGVIKDERFNALVERVLELPLDRTYHVVLHAMALEAIDRDAYQAKIADCAQFLVDNQCANGQWGYGTETPAENWKKIQYGKAVVTGTKKEGGGNTGKEVKINPGSTKSVKTNAYKAVKRKQLGGPSGDNSNTQYALLGLRACKEARIFIPDDTLKAAKKWLESSQGAEGGWAYCPDGQIANSTAYGSMTLGGLSSLCIVKFYLGEFKPGQKDKNIDRAMNWVVKKYSVSVNPDTDRQDYFYYYLYAMERAGVLAEVEKFGDHNWYIDGCTELVNRQETNGMWNKNNVSDTCFALLFLKLATKPLKAVLTGPSK